MGTVTRPAETVITAGVTSVARSADLAVGGGALVASGGAGGGGVAADTGLVGCPEVVLMGVDVAVAVAKAAAVAKAVEVGETAALAQALSASSNIKKQAWRISQGMDRLWVME